MLSGSQQCPKRVTLSMNNRSLPEISPAAMLNEKTMEKLQRFSVGTPKRICNISSRRIIGNACTWLACRIQF